ncbi:MAG: IspD/TarI family cytidylyltransferase [Phycisphaerales bacterium]|jgi:2-C-methyl-D-erythritol 4-phosphate cytidylyltransferase
MRICVIIPAAGASRRFGLGDKLGQDLGGRALLLRTVELFTKRDEVSSIVVAAPPDEDDFEQFRERYGAPLSFHGVRIVPGGRIERWETVKLALEAVPEDATHIAVHDAARPAASDELIDRVFEAAKVHAAVIPGLAVTSTVKRVSEETVAAAEDDALASAILGDAGSEAVSARIVESTMPRDRLVLAQTPQVFEASLLKRGYSSIDPSGTTDDASVIERLGERVMVVDGDPRNIKVTTPDDLAMVRSILGAKPPAERPVHKRF